MQAIKEKFPTSPEGKPIRNKPSAYQVYKYTWQNYQELSMHFARALVALGVGERSVVLIQGANTPEHMVCIMGTILANCVFSDIYPTNMPDVCLYQVKHSQAKVICCDTYARLKTKFLVNQEQLVAAGVKACILFDEGKTVDEIITVPGKCPIRIITWAQLITKTCSEIGTGVILKRIDN
jgi:long-subunit acyl-CoA synthetase (AMP-forming)